MLLVSSPRLKPFAELDLGERERLIATRAATLYGIWASTKDEEPCPAAPEPPAELCDFDIGRMRKEEVLLLHAVAVARHSWRSERGVGPALWRYLGTLGALVIGDPWGRVGDWLFMHREEPWRTLDPATLRGMALRHYICGLKDSFDAVCTTDDGHALSRAMQGRLY